MADIIEIIEAPSMPVIVVQPPTPIELTVSSGIANGAEFTPMTAISAAPPRIGKIAVVGAVAYIAVGTASTADWKQITN